MSSAAVNLNYKENFFSFLKEIEKIRNDQLDFNHLKENITVTPE